MRTEVLWLCYIHKFWARPLIWKYVCYSYMCFCLHIKNDKMIMSKICVAHLLHRVEDWTCMHMFFGAVRCRQHRSGWYTLAQAYPLNQRQPCAWPEMQTYVCCFGIWFDDKFEESMDLFCDIHVAYKLLWTYAFLQGCGFSRRCLCRYVMCVWFDTHAW